MFISLTNNNVTKADKLTPVRLACSSARRLTDGSIDKVVFSLFMINKNTYKIRTRQAPQKIF